MKKPKYSKVADDLIRRLEKGEWSPGENLPSEILLSEEYGVSRDTIRRSLDRLSKAKLISRQSGIGTTVAYDKADYQLKYLKSFSEQMLEAGKKPASELLSMSYQAIDNLDIYRFFKIPFGESIYEVVRIRLADQEKMALEYTYINPEVCPNLFNYLKQDVSLYEVYEKSYNLRIGSAKIALEAEIPSSFVKEKLSLQEHKPVLKMYCNARTEDGRALYYVICYYIGDKYQFTTLLDRQ